MKKKKATTKGKTQLTKESKKLVTEATKEKAKNIQIKNQGMNNQVVGEKTFMDEDGQSFSAVLINKTAYGDNNFYKLWLMDLLKLTDEMARGKMKIFFYLLDRMRKDNLILAGTTSEIARATKSSLKTVYETLAFLQERDAIRIIQRGVYQLSPNLVFKGGSNHRRAIMVMYNKLETIDLTENKQLNIDEQL